jgi:predicted Fe-Mo cluster-binding NifX family protein
METTAITYWNGLVSPLFDAAAMILIVDSNGDRRYIGMENAGIYAKADALQKHAAGVVVCGAISAAALAALQERGMRVIPWIRGPIEEVLLAHVAGTLETKPFLMPGCHGRGRCRRRRLAGMAGGRRHCRRSLPGVLRNNTSAEGHQ